MGIIRDLNTDFREGLMDNLRSVSYAETGVQSPFVTKDIQNPPNARGILLQGSKRVDDLTRVSKLLINKPGLNFLANEALLKQGDITKKLQSNQKVTAKSIIRNVGGTAKHLAQVVGSTLAQVPVNGTGTHFIRAFRTDTYLQDGNPSSGFSEFFGNGGVEGTKYALQGTPIPAQGIITDSELPSRNTTVNPGDIGKNHIGIQGTLTSPTDIALYTENSPYYNSTENNVLGVNGNGFVSIGIDPLDEQNPNKFEIQTTALPFSIGTSKDKLGAIDSEGLRRTDSISLIQNTFNPNADKEFISSKTETNVNNVKAGAPIRPYSKDEYFFRQTTANTGDFGTTNKDIIGDISNENSYKLATPFELGEIKSSNDTRANIFLSAEYGIIPLKDTPTNNLNFDLKGITEGVDNRNDPFKPLSTYTGFKTEENINNIQFGELKDTDGIIPLRVNRKKDPIQETSVPIPINDINSGNYQGLISTLPGKSRAGIEDFRSQGQTINVPVASTNFTGRDVGTYALDYNNELINKETRVGLGNQGKINRSRINYTSKDPDTVDKINALDVSENKPLDGVKENRDLIQLEFQIITPDDTFYLAFRAFLDTFDDSFNASWNSNKYLGRADNFYTYGGFERTINIGFKIAAASAEEMKPLYRKAATLASVTAPTYGSNGRFMRGSIAKVTVGDYIFEQPGIIESVQYTWQKDYPWEISFQNPEAQEKGQILPHVLDVSLSFKVIHDFLPTTGINPLITNHRPKNKETYIPLKKQEVVKTETEKEAVIDDSTESTTEVENNTTTANNIFQPEKEVNIVKIDKTYVNTIKFNPNKVKNLNKKFEIGKFNNNVKINNSNNIDSKVFTDQEFQDLLNDLN